MNWTRRIGLVVIVVAALAVAQLVRVHQETGEVRLTPSEAPPTLHEGGRDYRRTASTPTDRLPADTQEIGATPGGGELFGPRQISLHGPPVPGGIAVPVLYVRDDGGRVWTYALVGGP